MNEITLYELKNENIEISMKMYFNETNQLVFSGVDIGKSVGEVWGDSDYEYQYIIEPAEVKKIPALFGIDINDRAVFLQKMKDHFSGNDAYLKFGVFMRQNNIDFKGFTWI